MHYFNARSQTVKVLENAFIVSNIGINIEDSGTIK